MSAFVLILIVFIPFAEGAISVNTVQFATMKDCQDAARQWHGKSPYPDNRSGFVMAKCHVTGADK